MAWRRLAGVAATIAVAVAAAAPIAAETASCRSGYVALTFDDGPGRYTTPVLDALAARGTPATFFVIGRNIANMPSAIDRQVAEGHVTANHTHGHEDLTRQSDAGIRATVQAASDAVASAGARPLPVVRPPFGATNGRVHQVLRAAGYTHLLWTVDTRDWEAPPREMIEQRAIDGLAPGAVILLHDGHPRASNTAAALPRIIDTARERGFCLGVLDEQGHVVPPGSTPVPPPPPPPPPSEPAPVVCDGTPPAPFADRAAIAPAHMLRADCAYDRGLARGAQRGNQRYLEPTRPIRRDQLAALLARTLVAAGYVLPSADDQGFEDIAGNPHAADINRLAAAGIVRGTAATTFSPDSPARRDQMTVWQLRAARAASGRDLPPPSRARFTDLHGNPHRSDVEAAAAAELVRGRTDTTFGPHLQAARQQAVSLAVNLLAFLHDTGVVEPPDPEPDCLDLVLTCL